jgi:hypothetical protein
MEMENKMNASSSSEDEMAKVNSIDGTTRGTLNGEDQEQNLVDDEYILDDPTQPNEHRGALVGTELDVQAQYDLMDETDELFEQGLYEGKAGALPVLRRWVDALRGGGFPSIAYELEQLEIALSKGDAQGIAESLKRSGNLTNEAASKAEGMMEKKLRSIAEQLIEAGSSFEG